MGVQRTYPDVDVEGIKDKEDVTSCPEEFIT